MSGDAGMSGMPGVSGDRGPTRGGQPLRSYRDLDSWRTSIELVDAVYALTRSWPSDERFGLTSQARRAAVSVPANIAEGYGRIYRREYVKHLSIARGSLLELETHVHISVRQGFSSEAQAAGLVTLTTRIGQMLAAQIRALQAKEAEETAVVVLANARQARHPRNTP